MQYSRRVSPSFERRSGDGRQPNDPLTRRPNQGRAEVPPRLSRAVGDFLRIPIAIVACLAAVGVESLPVPEHDRALSRSLK